MNRLLVAALAACLAQFALGCAEEVTEIYEPAPTPGQTPEKIDPHRVSDDTPINYPVPTDVAEPLDKDLARVTDDHRDFLTPGVKFTQVIPPAVDIAVIPQLPNVDGVIIPTVDIDPNEMVPNQPSLGLAPLLIIDPPPTRGNASAVPGPLDP